jgi:hypothetical protein
METPLNLNNYDDIIRKQYEDILHELMGATLYGRKISLESGWKLIVVAAYFLGNLKASGGIIPTG